MFEYSLHSPIQPGHGKGAELVGSFGWVYPCPKEGFIGINVSKADNDGLIEEEGLDHSATAQKLFEIAQADHQRLWAQLGNCSLGQELGFGRK